MKIIKNIKLAIIGFIGFTNLFFWCFILFTVSLFKIIPIKIIQKITYFILDKSLRGWCLGNELILHYILRIRLTVTGIDHNEINRHHSYLIISNHLSWSDIVIIGIALQKHIPTLKFFLKKQLIYVPLMGIACWGLDMPFIHRYNRKELLANPELKNKNKEATLKSCQKFKGKHISMINYVESSRLTLAKHQKQNSPFTYLLKPKSGGISFSLAYLREQFKGMINTTIVYPDAIGNNAILKELLSGSLTDIVVHTQFIPINDIPNGDYEKDKEYRALFQQWLNQIWHEKDMLIEEILEKYQKKENIYQKLKQNKS